MTRDEYENLDTDTEVHNGKEQSFHENIVPLHTKLTEYKYQEYRL